MSDVASSRRMMAAFIFIVYGPICWALQLLLIYGGQSALCALGTVPQWLISAGVIAASAMTFALASAGAVWPEPHYKLMAGEPAAAGQWPFIRSVMQMLCGLSLLAMVYAALAAIMLPACPALR